MVAWVAFTDLPARDAALREAPAWSAPYQAKAAEVALDKLDVDVSKEQTPRVTIQPQRQARKRNRDSDDAILRAVVQAAASSLAAGYSRQTAADAAEDVARSFGIQPLDDEPKRRRGMRR